MDNTSLKGQLLAAAQLGKTDLVKDWIAMGAPVNELTKIDAKTERTPLMLAAENGHVNTLAFLLEHLDKEGINKATAVGNTALTCALWKGQMAAFMTLIQAGANPMITLKNGVTSFMLAAMQGHFDALKVLYPYYKEKLNEICNEHGNTALILAAGSGHNTIVSFLLMEKADPRIINRNKANALSAAAYNGHIDTVKILLPYLQPDDLNARTIDNITPCMLAAEKGLTEIAWLLLSQGAKLESEDISIDQEGLIAACNKEHEELAFRFLSVLPSEKLLTVDDQCLRFALKCQQAISEYQKELRQIMPLALYTEAFDHSKGLRPVLFSYLYPKWYIHRADKDAQDILKEMEPLTQEVRNLKKCIKSPKKEITPQKKSIAVTKKPPLTFSAPRPKKSGASRGVPTKSFSRLTTTPSRNFI